MKKLLPTDYARILNIGCSVGYYAVGLAVRMPHVIVEAFDIDAEARRKCLDMAQANGVEESRSYFGPILLATISQNTATKKRW